MFSKCQLPVLWDTYRCYDSGKSLIMRECMWGIYLSWKSRMIISLLLKYLDLFSRRFSSCITNPFESPTTSWLKSLNVKLLSELSRHRDGQEGTSRVDLSSRGRNPSNLQYPLMGIDVSQFVTRGPVGRTHVISSYFSLTLWNEQPTGKHQLIRLSCFGKTMSLLNSHGYSPQERCQGARLGDEQSRDRWVEARVPGPCWF